MFGGMKMSSSMRAQAMRSLHQNEEERRQRVEDSKKREEARMKNLGGGLNQWEMPDPRNEWDAKVENARQEKEVADAEKKRLLQARAQASRARLVRRERERSARASAPEQQAPEEPPSATNDTGGAYITVRAMFRGGHGLLPVTLTNEEVASMTVKELKARIAAESGVVQHAECMLMAGEHKETTATGGGNLLRDDWFCRNHVKDGYFLSL
eukprot:CAMPEP_0182853622 /NCGR_PEP_ID=MMETSP0034_2-20130328/800_1 /TAXON_ID=156128 /ORGANISM="Nephroselmis pyriformis, Strain CCMP717" /LENGTH=210 /DNA_ID=CAMNT_0024984401 /DNA_START=91 /DNA_END=719 /DNA_ORIENTATION=+